VEKFVFFPKMNKNEKERRRSLAKKLENRASAIEPAFQARA
jgi:hypothetical protein